MGDELWTSPLTGYRRHGTRLRDFQDALGSKISVSTIAEPLRSCFSQSSSIDVARLLAQFDFDVAGVKNSETSPVVGFVARADLIEGYVYERMRGIDRERLIESTAALPELLDRFDASPFNFVVTQEGVTGIVTLADLNKPIVRTYFFGLISLLEIHLGYWVSAEYPLDSWKESISEGRLAATVAKQEERRRRGQVLSLSQCLDFGDKSSLVSKSHDLRKLLNIGSRNRSDEFFGYVEGLRNSLAHSQYDLVGSGTWPDLIDLVRRIVAMVSLSDEEVERRAEELAILDIGSLW